jgi:hypothetical protein
MDAIRAGAATEQGRARQRAIMDEFLTRAGVRQVAPDSGQSPVPPSSGVTLSLDFSPTICIYGCTPPPVNRPIGPIPTLSDLPAMEYGGGAVSIKGDPNGGLWTKADSENINRIANDISRVADDLGQSMEDLNRLNLQFAEINAPPVPCPADDTLSLSLPDVTLSPSLPSLADSHGHVRAQASGVKVPKFVVKNLPCSLQCWVFYTNCDQGRWKNPSACEHGLSACKRTCPR